MAKVALITVHGMGVMEDNYAMEMEVALQKRLQGSGKSYKLWSVYYQDLLQTNERLVWTRTKQRGKVRYDNLREFLLYGFGDAAGLENRKEIPGSVYERAQEKIAHTLLAIHAEHGPNAALVLLTHSLGCHVLSSYIYDAQKYEANIFASAGIWKKDNKFIAGLSAEQRTFLACTTAKSWITTGCNIPIFVAAHKTDSIEPIRAPNTAFRWLNIYDPDDVLGWPLQPLSDSYDKLVEDRAINAGQGLANFLLNSWNPLSHTAYWTDDDVIKPLANFI